MLWQYVLYLFGERRNKMGYRNYLEKISKSDYVEGQSFWDYDDDIIIELHGLGKYIDSELVDDLITISSSDDGDGEFKIIDIESIPKIVSHYAKKHLDFLKTLDKGITKHFNFESYIKKQIIQWSRPERFVYNIDKNSDKIVRSWEFQYEIFNLIYIYKTFDVEKNFLLWTGY